MESEPTPYGKVAGYILIGAAAVYGLGLEGYRFIFRPELTEAEAFWQYWPDYVGIVFVAFLGLILISKGK